jgi:pimeloyl-ACP methyl ester carboxylesterase
MNGSAKSAATGAITLPVIFTFHGMFLSGQSFIQQIKPTAYVVISINRPGYHGSSSVKVGEYCYQHFAKDVEELADHLNVSKFSVVGHSSGGPNALACAYYLRGRVLSIGILAGDPEYAAVATTTARADDGQKYHKGNKEKSRNNENNGRTVDEMGQGPPQRQQDENDGSDDYDRAEEEEACHHSSFLMDCCMGCFLPNCMRIVPCLQVTNGLRNDYYLERQRYGFCTEDITQPGIVVLGDRDNILPNEVAMNVHHRLPNSQLRILEGLGHNDLLEDDELDKIFRTVIDLAKTTPA